MLLSKTVALIPRARAITYYKNKGYVFGKNEEIEVKVEDLPPGTNVRVQVECDYCHRPFSKTYAHFLEGRKVYPKDCCEECAQKKREEKYGITSPMCRPEVQEKAKNTVKEKYGVDNVMQLPEFQEKMKETNLERYGYATVGENPEFRKKQEESMLEKYGVRNVFCVGELRKQSYQKTLVKKAKDKTQPASKNQRYLCNLYEGELNALLCDHYFVDIYFEEEKIYCEYDGAGHDLNVQLGQTTREEFEKREHQRYHILKRNGYKVFRIKNTLKNEPMPSDEELLEIKRIAFEFLSQENNYWISFNLNTHIIRYEDNELNWEEKGLKSIKF